MHVLAAADGRLVARLERDLQDPALSGKVVRNPRCSHTRLLLCDLLLSIMP